MICYKGEANSELLASIQLAALQMLARQHTAVARALARTAARIRHTSVPARCLVASAHSTAAGAAVGGGHANISLWLRQANGRNTPGFPAGGLAAATAAAVVVAHCDESDDGDDDDDGDDKGTVAIAHGEGLAHHKYAELGELQRTFVQRRLGDVIKHALSRTARSLAHWCARTTVHPTFILKLARRKQPSVNLVQQLCLLTRATHALLTPGPRPHDADHARSDCSEI